jgi:hypothetical protein
MKVNDDIVIIVIKCQMVVDCKKGRFTSLDVK